MYKAQIILSLDNPKYPEEVTVNTSNPRELLWQQWYGRCFRCTGYYDGTQELSYKLVSLSEKEVQNLIGLAKRAGQECICIDLDGFNNWQLLYVNGPHEGLCHPSTGFQCGASPASLGNPDCYTVVFYPGYHMCYHFDFDFNVLEKYPCTTVQ